MPSFYEHRHHGMVVMDGKKLLCRATRAHAAMGARWMLKAYAFSWIDPRAQEVNIFGISQPQFLVVKNKREARSIMKSFCGLHATTERLDQ